MEFSSVSISEDYFRELSALLEGAKTPNKLYETVVNAPFHDLHKTTLLGLGIVVLLLVNKKNRTIDRIALANTEMARGTEEMSSKPFKEIKIPVTYTQNFIAKAIKEQHYMITSDWQYIFNPALSPEEARFNQAGGSISCSVIYPLKKVGDGGAIIFSFYENINRIGKTHHNFMSRYSVLVSQALRKLES
ncbi:hypothetical protein KW789_00315 [Candidatus Saccharibacteria bacterium]|jgi:hypothetical protein|nr:hypothetical protein [Candidatus Saccharibacteria bacterium]